MQNKNAVASWPKIIYIPNKNNRYLPIQEKPSELSGIIKQTTVPFWVDWPLRPDIAGYEI